jgi:acyl-CoA synthetase (AMP-forming)/AMP-acid ligase II
MADTIFSSLAARAERAGGSVALEATGRAPLTYVRLHEQLRYVVTTLNNTGIGRGDRVTVVLPGGSDLAVLSLGVLAGATVAPLNPEYKLAEFEYYFESLGAKLLITQAGLDSPARIAARDKQVPILELEATPESIAGVFRLIGNSRACGASGFAEAADIGLTLHTSGTTSRPKPVPLSQRNLWASVTNLVASLQLTTGDRCLHVLPQFHIGGLIDVLAAPLSVGGRVICTSGFSVPEFYRGLDHYQPTWCQAVPTMMQEILTYAEDHQAIIKKNSLRLMRSVSAPLPPSVLEAFERIFKVPVIEIFGMTETAGLITSNPLPPGARKPGSAGIAVGSDLGIIGATGERLAANQRGEVVVRGASLTAGYENLREENARTFVDGWFRTGDEGHLDADGYLFITGRIKEIINRGGEKIAPREVDEVLLTHPAVAEAATFAVPHASLGEDVAAAVVVRPGMTASKQELIAFLSTRLAYFKVPRSIHFVESLPKGAGGKLQRNVLAQRLSAAVSSTPAEATSGESASTPTAKTIAAMWAKALNVAAVGLHGDFFDLGGDSLKAASVINELQRSWGATVYVTAIFDAPTVSQFESYLERHYPELVAKMLGRYLSPTETGVVSKIDAAKVARLRQTLAVPGHRPSAAQVKNPPAVFVLSPPRSGSTLLRVMLGGNSKLFAPPEMYLLQSDTLAERKDWFSGSQRFQLEGNLRAVMQLRNMPLAEAQAWVRDLEDAQYSTREYYRMLQGWLDGKIFVDKTPSYAIHVETLQRAEEYFSDALYIHLLRHPYGTIRSFEEAKLEQLWYPRLVGSREAERVPCPYHPRELGEMIWLILHQNILAFLKGVPRHRQCRVRFEDLVGNPQGATKRLCEFLDVDFEPAMLEPQNNRRERMTDGVHPDSRMIGDMKFHQHSGIAAEVAETWRTAYQTDFLADDTWHLATALGYDVTVAQANQLKEFEI